MANRPLTDLTAATTLSDTDLLYLVTDVATTPVSKKITKDDFKESLLAFPETDPETKFLRGDDTWATVSAGTPTAITVANEATDETCFPLFVTAATGDLGPKSNAGLTFNSATAELSATSLRLANNNWLMGTDYAGTSYVNMFKVNASDEIDCGGTLNISGYMEGPIDGGAITVFDMPVVDALDDTEESATFKIDGNNFLKLYSLADGAGGIDNTRIYAYATLYPRTGSATAGTTPIIMTAGTVNTTPVAGAIEFDGTDLFISI